MKRVGLLFVRGPIACAIRAPINEQAKPYVRGVAGVAKEIVDLSPQQSLDQAEAFLASLGYTMLGRHCTNQECRW